MAELLFQSKQEKLPDGSPIIITKILGAIDGTTVRQFEDKLIGFFNQGVKNLILTFSEVKYINSTGMGLLVKLADKFQEGGGDIKLVGVPEKVIALFDMLGLLSLFKIYETEEDAVDSISHTDIPKANSPQMAPVAPQKPITAPGPAVPPRPAPAPMPAGGNRAMAGGGGRPPGPAVTPRPAPSPARPPMQTPPPAPVAAPMAPMPDVMGGGLDISGGIEIGGEDDFSAPAPSLVSWPYDALCEHCRGNIQFSSRGNFQCPRCHSFIAINEYGQQTVYSSTSSKLSEIKCPCTPQYNMAVKAMVNGLATQVGFSQIFCGEINEAIDNALGIVIDKSNQNFETYQVLAVADNNEMILGLKSLNPFLVQGAPRDPRLPVIARKVDRLEVFPLPNQGQLLKMTKKRK
ncbi:MAG TPA: STAS domain-containing protein [Planctomycetota bacterium]|jgi:anti-anti-sigma factor|nr:STAS domain-containing protein [Planctomycetota bacterium]HQA99537.1 STAS domain-containing protein [Planctomycetota bacterium]